MRGFLQLADTSPNVGAKAGRREEGRGMNEGTKVLGGLYIGGAGYVATGPSGNPRRHLPHLAAAGP
jgi:hypothetical protein